MSATVRVVASAALALGAILCGATSASASGPWIPAPSKVNTCYPNCLPLALSMAGVMDSGDGLTDACSDYRFRVLSANKRVALVTVRNPGACADASSIGWLFHNANGVMGAGQLWQPIAATGYDEMTRTRYCQFDVEGVEYRPGEPGYAKVKNQILKTGICG